MRLMPNKHQDPDRGAGPRLQVRKAKELPALLVQAEQRCLWWVSGADQALDLLQPSNCKKLVFLLRSMSV